MVNENRAFIRSTFTTVPAIFIMDQVLSGHEGPVSSLCFSPTRSILASSSWDKTVKLWDVFESKGNIETLGHSTDGKRERERREINYITYLALTLTYSPDGSQLAVATLDGVISLWDIHR